MKTIILHAVGVIGVFLVSIIFFLYLAGTLASFVPGAKFSGGDLLDEQIASARAAARAAALVSVEARGHGPMAEMGEPVVAELLAEGPPAEGEEEAPGAIQATPADSAAGEESEPDSGAAEEPEFAAEASPAAGVNFAAESTSVVEASPEERVNSEAQPARRRTQRRNRWARRRRSPARRRA